MSKISTIKWDFVSTIFVFVLILLDQITKILAVNALSVNNPIVLIDNVLEFFYLENTGAAFSFLTNMPWVFLIATPIITVILIIILFRIPNTKRFLPIKILFIFIISGAIGNYIDRVRFGYVRDFIYFKLIDFPVFNVADIYVTCSIIVFIILFIFYYKEDEVDFIIFGKKKDKDNG